MLMELGWRRLLRELLELSISWPEKHITGKVVNDDPLDNAAICYKQSNSIIKSVSEGILAIL